MYKRPSDQGRPQSGSLPYHVATHIYTSTQLTIASEKQVIIKDMKILYYFQAL